jgi:group II intron reverse transcriptase/maturase
MSEESVDTDVKADSAWLLDVQRKLYQWSREHPEEAYRELWGWVTDLRNLRCAWRTVAANKGKRTPGIDGVTVKHIRKLGEAKYLEALREELRQGTYLPSPARRKFIPKPGKPGEFRPLGIATVKDRIVQCAVKQSIEPLFEAAFWQVSYGFRPGRSCHGALEHIRSALTVPTVAKDGKRHANPYPWVIEGDIKGCFDNLSQHQILERIRRRCADRKVIKLIRAFLKAGVLAEDQFIRTDAGTPQGGNLSPLLANVALEVIEERYARWVYRAKDKEQHAARLARMYDRRAGKPVFFPIRYADDFVILVSGTYDDAVKEKEALATYLHNTAKLTLSQEKTHITPITQGFEFLGHRVRMKWEHHYGYRPRIEIPKPKVADIRDRIQQLTTRSTTTRSLALLLRKLNALLRGWGYFYRYCTGAKRILGSVDWYVGGRLMRWMGKKYPKAGVWKLLRPHRWSLVHPTYRVWQDGREEQFLMGCISVQRFRLGWMRRPDYA